MQAALQFLTNTILTLPHAYLEPRGDAILMEGVEAGEVCQVIASAVSRLADDTGVTVCDHAGAR